MCITNCLRDTVNKEMETFFPLQNKYEWIDSIKLTKANIEQLKHKHT